MKSLKLNFLHQNSDVILKVNLKFVSRLIHTSVSLMNILAVIVMLFMVVQASSVEGIFDNTFISHGYKFKLCFFSLWVSILQYVYFFMHSIIDIMEVTFQHAKCSRIIETMHSIASYLLFTIIFPVSLTVAILFWSIYFYNRDLIYPSFMDEYIPMWVNHVIHTFPVPLSLLYMITSNKKEPSKTATLTGLVAFLSIYSCVLFYNRFIEGAWPYLVLEYTTPTQTQLILSTPVTLSILFHFMGYKINKIFQHLRSTSKYLH